MNMTDILCLIPIIGIIAFGGIPILVDTIPYIWKEWRKMLGKKG